MYRNELQVCHMSTCAHICMIYTKKRNNLAFPSWPTSHEGELHAGTLKVFSTTRLMWYKAFLSLLCEASDRSSSWTSWNESGDDSSFFRFFFFFFFNRETETVSLASQNHRSCVQRDLKAHPIPTLLLWAELLHIRNKSLLRLVEIFCISCFFTFYSSMSILILINHNDLPLTGHVMMQPGRHNLLANCRKQNVSHRYHEILLI